MLHTSPFSPTCIESTRYPVTQPRVGTLCCMLPLLGQPVLCPPVTQSSSPGYSKQTQYAAEACNNTRCMLQVTKPCGWSTLLKCNAVPIAVWNFSHLHKFLSIYVTWNLILYIWGSNLIWCSLDLYGVLPFLHYWQCSTLWYGTVWTTLTLRAVAHTE